MRQTNADARISCRLCPQVRSADLAGQGQAWSTRIRSPPRRQMECRKSSSLQHVSGRLPRRSPIPSTHDATPTPSDDSFCLDFGRYSTAMRPPAMVSSFGRGHWHCTCNRSTCCCAPLSYHDYILYPVWTLWKSDDLRAPAPSVVLENSRILPSLACSSRGQTDGRCR